VPEPFGKRNRRVAVKALPAKKKKPGRGQSPKSNSRATFYFYVAGAVLFVIFTGYALAS
jgi:hypothetical protein